MKYIKEYKSEYRSDKDYYDEVETIINSITQLGFTNFCINPCITGEDGGFNIYQYNLSTELKSFIESDTYQDMMDSDDAFIFYIILGYNDPQKFKILNWTDKNIDKIEINGLINPMIKKNGTYIYISDDLRSISNSTWSGDNKFTKPFSEKDMHDYINHMKSTKSLCKKFESDYKVYMCGFNEIFLIKY